MSTRSVDSITPAYLTTTAEPGLSLSSSSIILRSAVFAVLSFATFFMTSSTASGACSSYSGPSNCSSSGGGS